MTEKEAKSCIRTIELLRRLAFNVHGVMDVIDAGNCDKIISMLSQEPCEDCISRREVLNILLWEQGEMKQIQMIKELPPVIPEQAESEDKG